MCVCLCVRVRECVVRACERACAFACACTYQFHDHCVCVD